MATKAAPSSADKLKALKGVSKTKEKAPSKTEIRVIDFTGTPVESAIAKMCELGYIEKQLKPVIEQHKKAAQDVFFDRWTQELFDSKKVPENFKARIKKKNKDGTPSSMDDMACNFILKFRADGISKKIPGKTQLDEEGKTAQEVILETITSGVVGLTPQKASEFVENEILVVEGTDLAEKLEVFLAADEGTDLRVIGDYLVACLTAESKKDLSKLNPLTDAQRAASLMVVQTVTIKDGVEERILQYVENIDQLRKLLRFLAVTEQVSNYEFGISDDVDDRSERLTDVACRHLDLAVEDK